MRVRACLPFSGMRAGRQVPPSVLHSDPPMFYVYVLKSLSRNYIYVGMTDNLERRIHQHHAGLSRTTRAYRPFVVILTETFPSRAEARKREKYLKSGFGKIFLKSLSKLPDN